MASCNSCYACLGGGEGMGVLLWDGQQCGWDHVLLLDQHLTTMQRSTPCQTHFVHHRLGQKDFKWISWMHRRASFVSDQNSSIHALHIESYSLNAVDHFHSLIIILTILIIIFTIFIIRAHLFWSDFSGRSGSGRFQAWVGGSSHNSHPIISPI